MLNLVCAVTEPEVLHTYRDVTARAKVPVLVLNFTSLPARNVVGEQGYMPRG